MTLNEDQRDAIRRAWLLLQEESLTPDPAQLVQWAIGIYRLEQKQ